MSLWDGDTNLFLDEDDPRGLGLSEQAYHFIGGLKKHARAYSALTAPTVNSYKRLKLGSTTSGATWSPVWISYGYNNRTQMLRIPAPGRIEDRTIDGSANPYLAAAAVLAAGLDGIEKRPRRGRAEQREPLRDLLRRADRSAGSRRCRRTSSRRRRSSSATTSSARRSARGAARTTSTTSSSVKRDEWSRYHEQVTRGRSTEYLTRF